MGKLSNIFLKNQYTLKEFKSMLVAKNVRSLNIRLTNTLGKSTAKINFNDNTSKYIELSKFEDWLLS